jgi:hypothetical protein
MFRCVTTEIHFSCFPKFRRRLTHPTGYTYKTIISHQGWVYLNHREWLVISVNPPLHLCSSVFIGGQLIKS